MMKSQKQRDETRWMRFRDAMLVVLGDVLGCGQEAIPIVFREAPKGRPRALKVGIHLDIMARFPGADERKLHRWLAIWTQQRCYLFRLAHGLHRHDLDGDDVELIADEHRWFARGALGLPALDSEAA